MTWHAIIPDTGNEAAWAQPSWSGAMRAIEPRMPLVAPSRIFPSASTSAGRMPGSGSVAEPGLSAVAPGSGLMRMPPVSVCHQVSTIGQRDRPTVS